MTPTFPVTYSTLAARPLSALISTRFGWHNVQCHLLLRGVSDTYNVCTSSGNFVLRVYRNGHRSLSQINAEVEFLLALKNSRVSVSYPLPDRDGHHVFTLEAPEGTRHGVVFTHAPGAVRSAPNVRQLKLLGREMAKLHTVSTNLRLASHRWNFDAETTLTKPLIDIKDYFKDCPEEYEWLRRASEETQHKISQLDRSVFTSGYCHFDFFPKNFHFEGDDCITFFDFDFFGYGWIVNDIMTFQQHLCFEVEIGRISEKIAAEMFKVFVEAYREIRPLSREEMSAIPLLSLGFWMFYFGFYTTHDQFLPLLQDPHLTARTKLIREVMKRSARLRYD
ncbi:MAG: phosphotransferase [Chryseosolibacter sp.]